MRVNSRLGAAAAAIAMASVALTGCGSGSGKNTKIDNLDYSVNFIQGEASGVLVSLKMKGIEFDGGGRIVPDKENMPNSYIEIGPDFESNSLLVMTFLSTADVATALKLKLGDPNTLPGGRPIPTVRDGVLPSLAVEIPALNSAVVYFGTKFLGLFYPFKNGLDGAMLSYRLYDGKGLPMGTITLVGNDSNGKNSGIFLAVTFNTAVKAALEASARQRLF